MQEATSTERSRPISPFLFPPTGTYRWQLTSTLSILHRVTGLALGIGTLMLTWWLLALLGAPSDFAAVQRFIGSLLGRFLLLGWTWALFFHLFNGVRHLIWDTGHGLDLPNVYRGGWLVVGLSVVLTVATWFAGYWLRQA
jgi:succinate dehydrogenase / fumarate reductase cytochrome b subunit